MTQWKEFFKSSFLAAIGIVLPIVLLAILFEKAVDLLGGITTPIAKALFPVKFAEGVYGTRLAVVVLILLLSFGIGILAQTSLGQRIGQWIEHHTLMRFNLYKGLKEFSNRILPSATHNQLLPGLLVRDDEMNMLIYVVEAVGNESFLIFVPSVPSVFSGNLFIVPKSDVQVLPIKPFEMAKVIARWGVGTHKLLETSVAQSFSVGPTAPATH